MLQYLTYLVDRAKGKVPAGARRSSKWPTIRRAFLMLQPTCQLCGGSDKLEVHHIIPFHMAPELELEFGNLVTLCERKKYGVNCHQFFGHLGDYRRFNSTIRQDLPLWSKRVGPLETK